ncbi:eukaryotic translation initiation factor 1A-like [Salvia hispanica]|uniref:eukaryotic translation initiation factor 1A-like n=1 Tax=Salvia hispanica TaxID=49212 RepID=UPI0020096773|nr:eukaryotic translation initiation factor 1A-like [Salvia hispanica]
MSTIYYGVLHDPNILYRAEKPNHKKGKTKHAFLQKKEAAERGQPSDLGFPAMPKNKGKGGKNRKRGKNEADDEKRELVFKEDGQEYAQVMRMLGNGRCEATCIDGVKRLCHIRGKMHKKVWIGAGDIILVGLRDYQDDKADVILKYMPDEARLLKAYGELPENTRLNEGIAAGLDEEEDGPGDDYIEFEDEDLDKL